jgi:hypothetical protein
MKRPRGRMTAEEHEAWLKTTGQYDAIMERRRQQDLELRRREAEWRKAEAPLIRELRAAGIEVESAWDLVNTSEPYPAALPILAAHLQRSYPPAVREGIARALAVAPAKSQWEVLVRLYASEKEARVKDGLAVAIAAAADDEVIDQVIALARNQDHGESRLLLLSAFARSRDEHARRALAELEADPQLRREVRAILRRTKHGDRG